MKIPPGRELVLLFSLAWLPAAEAVGQGKATGLIPATAEQLRGVPLASTPFSGAELPGSVDLASLLPPPQHQGALNSCTAWSLAYALKSYQEHLEEKRPYAHANGRLDATRVFSPSFLYNQLNQGRNAGIPFVDAFRLLREQGAAPWSEMPYDGADFTSRPSPGAFAAARRYRIDHWRQVNVQDPREIKAHLNAGYPVPFGAKMDPAFEAATAGFVWRTTAPGGCGTGGACGYHAMVLVGYDDARNAFKLINSWGTGWGDGGYGWIDYAHFSRVSSEAYVAKDARNDPAAWNPVPTPNPQAPPALPQFAVTATTHNALLPDRPQDGYYLRFDGTLALPPGSCSTDQVAIGFWYDGGGGSKGAMVRATLPAYSTVHGQAACGTALYPVPITGLTTTWAAWIPYNALPTLPGFQVPTPTGLAYQPRVTGFVAEAVLYLDGFGVSTTPPIPFTVTR